MANSEQSTVARLLGEARPVWREIEAAVVEYVEAVQPLDIVDQIILGADCNKGRAYVFNVLREEFSVRKPAGEKQDLLSQAGAKLTKRLEPIWVRVTLLNPSQMNQALEKCKKLQFEIERIDLRKKPLTEQL